MLRVFISFWVDSFDIVSDLVVVVRMESCSVNSVSLSIFVDL